MFGIKRKPQEPVEETSMGYVEIRGIGRVEVNSMPSAIPSHIMVGDRKTRINKDLYLWLWANVHGTPEGVKKLSAIL